MVIPRSAEVFILAAEVFILAGETPRPGAEGLIMFSGGESILRICPIMVGGDGRCPRDSIAPFVKFFLSFEALELFYFFTFGSHVCFY